MMKLQTEDIRVSFAENIVLRGISAAFAEGTLNAVIGVNGAGKTVYVKSIANLLPFTGRVRLENGNSRYGINEIAYVPQMTAITSELTVMEMVLLGKVRQLVWRVRPEVIREVEEVLSMLNLEDLAERRFSTLSGGQKQLVVMAQSIISKPKVLLLDEPTSALDLKHQIEVLDVARKYSQTHGAITLVVMHDLSLVSRYSDTVLVLDGGNVLRHGSPVEVMEKDLLEKVYGVEVEVSTTELGYRTVTPICVAAS